MTTGRVRILQAAIDRIPFLDLVAAVDRHVQERGDPIQIVTCNVDHLYKLRSDHEFQSVYEKAEFIVADGVPLLWVSKFLGEPIPGRVNGTDLMERLCQVAAAKGYRVFFFGGREGVASRCADALRRKFPDMKIAGAISPSGNFVFPSKEHDAIVEEIRRAKPHILLVGLSGPKQEVWISRYKSTLGIPVSLGAGASFNFLAGDLRRAPKILRKAGLEWFWRMLLEPRRLFIRYLRGNTYFVIQSFQQIVRKRLMRSDFTGPVNIGSEGNGDN